MESEQSETWTKENLQRLLAKLKDNIPEAERCTIYSKAQKKIDWNDVAFPPFSPAECELKWTQILQKMRKIRSLTELITEAEDVISNPDHNKRIHPELPKKPSLPNVLYFEENYTRLKEQYPQMSTALLVKFATKLFKGLPDKEKAPYVEKYNLAFKEHNIKMLEFRHRYDKLSPQHLKNYQRRSIYAGIPDEGEDTDCLPRMPPRNGYNLFCREQTLNMEGSSRRSSMAEWAQRWADLGESERKLYAARCRELKAEYAKKIKGYLKGLDEKDQKGFLQMNNIKIPKNLKAKSTKRSYVFISGEPKMPAWSGNAVFCQTQIKLLRKKIPDPKQRLAEAVRMWKKLSKEEKKHYKEAVAENMKKYWIDLQMWFDTLTATQQKEYLKSRPGKGKHLTQKTPSEEEIHHLPSDSEDDDIEDSSSDEEETDMDWNKDEHVEEEEEEDDDIIFEID